MSVEDDLRAMLRAQAQALNVPERPALDRDVVAFRRRPGSRWLLAAACLVLIVAAVIALALRRADNPEPAPPIDSVVPDTTVLASTVAPSVPDTTIAVSTVDSVVPGTTPPAPVANGWVAFDVRGGNIYLVRPGVDARLLEVAGWDTADDACPAWSVDGTRLLFGRVTGASDSTPGEAELVIVPVGVNGETGDSNVIPLDGFDVIEGFDNHPCGIWAPDGRWVAFAGTGDVWLVDTQTAAVRRLPDLRPSDLEWRPGTDQLTIAGDMGTDRGAPTLSTPVTVYSVSADELHQLGSVSAAFVTWSPDGSTLAYRGGESDPPELWLVDADGANERLLVTDMGDELGGVGPVWSPAGDRIAYQRLIGGGERHEVVLVNVADGTETVIDPPSTDGPDGSASWYPYTVTWSPDGTNLLYQGWRQDNSAIPGGLIAVPAGVPSDVTVLADSVNPGPDSYSHRWIPAQMWGRQPG